MSASSTPHHKAQAKVTSLAQALESGDYAQARHLISKVVPAVELAELLEASPPRERLILWDLISSDMEGEVLQYLSDDLQAQITRRMSVEQLADMTADLDTDDVADILQQLPERLVEGVLDSMDEQDRSRVEEVLAYPEDCAGGLMNTDTITIRPDLALSVVLRYLRRHDDLPEMTDALTVINRQNEFIGVLSIRKLLVSDPNQTVREVMNTDCTVIHAEQHESEVAQIFEKHDLVSAPVVDKNGKLVGRITIDDVVDVIRDTADHSLMSMAGLDEDEDTFAPTWITSRRRAVWLGVNLLTAFAASAVISAFDAVIAQVVALAVLMPIVASMGGIAGSQVLTLVIRGQAIGQLSSSNIGWLIKREVAVSMINGALWAGVISAITWFWFNDANIALVIALSIMINLLVAALSGALLPLLLKKMGIDPALAGSVILTTVTDVVGFMTFLGLASALYL